MSTEEASSSRRSAPKDIFALAIKERDSEGKGKEKNVDDERSLLICGSKRTLRFRLQLKGWLANVPCTYELGLKI
jgi:hypothetical protein